MSENSNDQHRMSRREFLKKAAIVGAGAAATAAGIKLGLDLTSEKKPSETKNLVIDGENFRIELGSPERPNILGLSWFPDGHSSFIRTEDGVKVFLSGGPYGYMVEGESLNSLGERKK